MTCIGTAYWATRYELRKHYQGATDAVLAEGRATVGKPPVKPGERLLLNRQGRYVIETTEENPS